MLANPFRRRAKTADSQPSKASGAPAITIATDGISSKRKGRGGKEAVAASDGAEVAANQPPQLRLPPESSYRTSLIMPHLTRRFTLLQAPDGTMVTPDAMRAHLRAQRQRARVEGQPGANFLTEQEEDEIIEQMKRQTRLDADIADSYQAGMGTTSGPRTFQAGGTDGFGGDWASTSRLTSSSPTSSSRSGNYDRLGSLAETLGDLNASSSSNAMVPSASSGSLFSGRSSQRDHAYLRSLDKPKAPQLPGRSAEPAIEEEEELSTADTGLMPGGFASTANTIDTDEEVPRSGSRPPQPPRTPSGSRPSGLLTTLSPEAFRRVSTALEEVISLVAPAQYGNLSMGESESSSYEVTGESVENTDDDCDEADAAGADQSSQPATQPARYDPFDIAKQEEREEGEASTSYSSGAGTQHKRHYSDATGRTNGSSRTHDADDEEDEAGGLPRSPVRLPRLRRTSAKGKRSKSPESDTTSFTSAIEDAANQSTHLSFDDDHVTNIAGTGLTPSGSLQQELGLAYTKSSQTLLGLDGEMTPSASATNTIVAATDVAGGRTATADEGPVEDSDTQAPSQQITPKMDRELAAFETPVRRVHTRQGTADSSRGVLADSARKDRLGELVASSTPMSPSRSAPPDSPTTRFHRERGADGSRGPHGESSRRPLSPGGASSSLHQPVLSADAIAARSQHRYFPQTPTSLTRAATADMFASGFRQTPSAAGQNKDYRPGSGNRGGIPDAYAASSALANVTKDVWRDMGASPPATAANTSPLIADDTPAKPATKEVPHLEISRLSVADPNGDSPVSPFGNRSDQSEGDDDVWAKVARNLETEESNFDESSDTRLPYIYGGRSSSSGVREDGASQAREVNSTFGHDSWRPISHLPPQELEATGGVTMSQLAQLQANLVRSASQKQPGRTHLGMAPAVPDIPRRYSSATSATGSARHSARYDAEDGGTPRGNEAGFTALPLEAASNAQPASSRVAQSSPVEVGNSALSPTGNPRTPELNGGTSHGAAPPLAFTSPARRAAANAVAMQPQESSPASQMTKSSSVRSFNSQVMYDVTTSHRPTSPPLRRMSTQGSHRRNNSSLNNLPTLHDLSLRLHGVGSGRESSTGYRPMLDPAIGGLSHDEPITIGQALESQSSDFENGERDYNERQQQAQRPESEADDKRPLSSGGQGVSGYTGLFGLHTPDMAQDSRQSGQFEPVDAYGGYEADASMPFSPDQTLSSEAGEPLQQRSLGPPLDVTALSPASAQSAWSGRSGSVNSRREVSGDMIQDVASQARAATRALKGPQAVESNGPHIPPRRSKSLSKKKSRKNPGKIIGPPQLLKTTQSLFHAQPIAEGDERADFAAGSGVPAVNRTGGAETSMRPPVPKRELSDYSNNPKILPATLFEERQDNRRSSFGNTGDASGVGPMSTVANPPIRAQSRMQSATPTDGRQFRSASVPSTPIKEKSREPGSFGRLMSRMRSRKGSATNGLSDQQTTVDPYPASTGNGAGGSEMSSRLASPTNERSTTTTRNQSPFGFSGYAMQAAESIPESTSQEELDRRQQALTPTQPLAFNGTRRPSGVSPSASPENSYAPTFRNTSPIRELRSPSRLGAASKTPTSTSRSGTLSPTDDRGQARSTASSRNGQRNAPVESPALIQDGLIGDVTSQAISYGETDQADKSGELTPLPLGATSAAEEEPRPLLPHSDSMRTISGGQTAPVSSSLATDKELPGRPVSPMSPTVPEKAKPKSKRDTIVRRTLIFPGDATFVEEKRKSMASVASKRKSRRHGDHPGLDAKGLTSPVFRGGGYGSGIPDSPHLSVQKLPTDTTGMPTTESKSSLVGQALFAKSPNLRPPSPVGSNYGSSQGAASSYAGSLYDMYVEGDRHSAEVSAFHYDDYEGSRSSYLPEGVGAEKNHIEVTERADGSIVWQVIAGLGGKERLASVDGNRNSRYTGYSGHSRADSQSSQLSFLQRASLEASPNPAGLSGPAFMERTFSGLPANRDEDSRSLFARQRSGKQAALDQRTSDLPPVPLLPPFNPVSSAHGQTANGSGGPHDGTEVSLPAAESHRQERSFDMATPSAGVTRVVYSNDVELEQLLEAMARRTDAAKFHFDPRSRVSAASSQSDAGPCPGPGSATMQRDDTVRQGDHLFAAPGTQAGTVEGGGVDGGLRPLSDLPDEAARKVEEEIMSILALRGEQGGRMMKEGIYPGRGGEEESAHRSVEQTATTPRQSQEGFA